jgi:hypothetical protein
MIVLLRHLVGVAGVVILTKFVREIAKTTVTILIPERSHMTYFSIGILAKRRNVLGSNVSTMAKIAVFLAAAGSCVQVVH